MPGRSFPRSFAAVALAIGAAACSKKPVEVDPAKAKALAEQLVANVPVPAAVPNCDPKQLEGGIALTFRTLLELAGRPVTQEDTKEPTQAAWINPTELDAPTVRMLLDPAMSTGAKRRAAATFTSAKQFVVYKIDVVNAPIALQVKHLVPGTIHSRTILYGKDGAPQCVLLVDFQNDKAKSDWAIAQSDKAMIDPAVAKAMRDDLREQWLKHAPGRPAK